MNAEKIVILDKKNLPALKNPMKKEEKVKKRVDINDLLNRVRESKKKQSKNNLVFFGIFASVILVVGIILSF